MSAKAISETYGKGLLARTLPEGCPGRANILAARVTSSTTRESLVREYPFCGDPDGRFVCKPDQLIKRRGKLGLVGIDLDLDGALAWINERMGNSVRVGSAQGMLTTFIIEPFVRHTDADEHYVCIYTERKHNTILFCEAGGVDVGDVDSKANRMHVELGEVNVSSSSADKDEAAQQRLLLNPALVSTKLLTGVSEERRAPLSTFISHLYTAFCKLHFSYLEINPLVVVSGQVYVLDLAAKLDQTAGYLCRSLWGPNLEFPPPFGRDQTPEELHIAEMDAKSGASLKLTILNPHGRVWTMVAGGGASVVYSDTICDLGAADELANYGEYSGAPSENQTFEYARTLITLMTRGAPRPDGKVLIIGGGIANFTNVAATFKGIIRALREHVKPLLDHGVDIYVRRGGPNYQEGLRSMRQAGRELGLSMHVYGPESHMTAIVAMALGKREIVVDEEAEGDTGLDRMAVPAQKAPPPAGGAEGGGGGGGGSEAKRASTAAVDSVAATEPEAGGTPPAVVAGSSDGISAALFTPKTRALLFGLQSRAVQEMLDFDYCCGRAQPSVAGMIYPFRENHTMRFYWGAQEISVPVYKRMEEAMRTHPEVDVLINFASLRSAYDAAMEALAFPQIRVMAVVAEGIPENYSRRLIACARSQKVTLIGPATVGALKPGCFKIGNTGGRIDNVLAARLYRPGSVAYVSRSGGMSNELNNIIARNTDGVFEGVAIGGDRFPGTTFIDHLLRYQADPACKMLVLLGEVGGVEEYAICEAVKTGLLSKPMVAWCVGTCGTAFSTDVQFGHAGASAHSDRETAAAKNTALRAAGCVVPASFDALGESIKTTFDDLVASGAHTPADEPPVPRVPVDYAWARELGLVRKPAAIVSSISDERGDELAYAGVPITRIVSAEAGVGRTLGLLWFRRELPSWACRFIELCLVLTADHGPAVSGAHNTIVTARAGKDLVSSLTAGLLTIGDRFGGALDGAAQMFSAAFDAEQSPSDFVADMRAQHRLIMGIGHRVKSVTNPDKRVEHVLAFCRAHFPKHPLLDYALKVEKVTTAKRPNLILNVDGAIAVAFVDLLRCCGRFTLAEAAETVDNGALNGLFVLGRTMGFIGHYLDQKRLKQPLYRHPWDDISYASPPDHSQYEDA